MKWVLKDEIGNRYGRLIVIGRAPNRKSSASWVCKCDCGKETIVSGSNLRFNFTKSCGCLKLEMIKRKGPNSSNWKGGRKITSSGYVRIYMPNDVRADNKGYIPEHVYVMSQYLGRPVLRDETVHHKNGIKTDNRIENLELKVGNHVKGITIPDLIVYCQEILQKYAPELLKNC